VEACRLQSHPRGPWRPTGGQGPRPCSREGTRGDDRQTYRRFVHCSMIIILHAVNIRLFSLLLAVYMESRSIKMWKRNTYGLSVETLRSLFIYFQRKDGIVTCDEGSLFLFI